MTPIEVLTSTSHFRSPSAPGNFRTLGAAARRIALAAESRSKDHFWASTTANRHNALMTVEPFICVPNDFHPPVRFESSEAFSYVALRGSFTLSGRALRIRRHI